MRKSTIKSLVSYLNGEAVTNIDEIKQELIAELNRGAEKAQANRELYAQAHEAVIAVLAENAGVELSVRDIVENAELPEGFTASKVQYGLLNYWADEVVKHDNGREPNTYTLRV